MAKRKSNSSKSSEVIDGLQRIDLSPVKTWLSTGCTILDLAIANQLPGGFATGRISHVYGPESSAKTVIAQEPLGCAQRRGGEAWFADAEWTLDMGRAHLFGLDVENAFHYLNPSTIEELFDTQIKMVLKDRTTDDPPAAMAIDSLSALPSKAELEEDLGATGYGTTRAKQLSRAFRTFIWKLNQANLALIFVDQTRDDIGNAFNKYTTSGGKALGFYASTRVLLETRGSILNTNKPPKPVGVKIGFKVTKNKVAPPHRSGTFLLRFDQGIDNVGTNLEWLRENGADEGGSGWYAPGGSFGDKKFGSGLVKASILIEEANLEHQLEQRVYEVWQECYRTEDRKIRVRE